MKFRRRNPDSRRHSEATKARLRAERERDKAAEQLKATKAETPYYRRLAEALVEVQRENHLGERVAELFGGGRP